MPTQENPPLSIANRNRGPGPAAVMLPTTMGCVDHDPRKTRAPCYTMRIKPPLDADNWIRPAPNAYTIEKYYTRFGKDGTPQYTARGSLNSGALATGPGPAEYHAEDVPPMKTNRGPHYSISDRHNQRSITHSPAPNTYTLPEVIGDNVIYKPNNPAQTMSGYPTFVSYRYQPSPGPATYIVGPLELTLPRAPAYTLSNKLQPPPGGTMSPGPGKYFPSPVHCCTNNEVGASFGIKHSPYTTPLILPCDN